MKILSAVLNNIETDQRLDKVCCSLMKFGYEVELIGATINGKPVLNKPYKTFLIEQKNQSTMKKYAEFNYKLFFTLLRKSDKQTILLANDLDSLLPFYLVNVFAGALPRKNQIMTGTRYSSQIRTSPSVGWSV